MEPAPSPSETPPPPRTRGKGFWIVVAVACALVMLITFWILGDLVVSKAFPEVEMDPPMRARVDIREIGRALAQYAENNGGTYPDTLEPLAVPDEKGSTYLPSTMIPMDPWGRSYLYLRPGPGNARPRVLTYGRDGKPGGVGDDADIDSTSVEPGR